MIRDFKDFIKYIKYEVLDKDFNEIYVSFYDNSIAFELYDSRTIAIEYCGDPDDITVCGLEDAEGEEIDFSVIKDVYGIMKAIKDNYDLLDEFLEK